MKFFKSFLMLMTVGLLMTGCFDNGDELTKESVTSTDNVELRRAGGGICDILSCPCFISLEIENVSANPGWSVSVELPAGPAGLTTCMTFTEEGVHNFMVNSNGAPLPVGGTPNYTYWLTSSYSGSGLQMIDVEMNGCASTNGPFTLDNFLSSSLTFVPSSACN